MDGLEWFTNREQALNETASSVMPEGFDFDPERYDATRKLLTKGTLFPDQQAASTEAYNEQYKEWYESPSRMVYELQKAGINPLTVFMGSGNATMSASTGSGASNKTAAGSLAAIIASIIGAIAKVAAAA